MGVTGKQGVLTAHAANGDPDPAPTLDPPLVLIGKGARGENPVLRDEILDLDLRT